MSSDSAVGERVLLTGMEHSMNVEGARQSFGNLFDRVVTPLILKHPLVLVKLIFYMFPKKAGLMLKLSHLEKRGAKDVVVVVKWQPKVRASDPEPPQAVEKLLENDGHLKVAISERIISVDFTVDVYAAPFSLGYELLARRHGAGLDDVELVVDGKRFPAHRAVLAARSPVFNSMFSGDFKERAERSVELQEVSGDVFDKFLEFVYTGAVRHWGDDGVTVRLLELADRYLVQTLKDECERRLLQVDQDGAVQLLRQAVEKPFVSSIVRRHASRVLLDHYDALKESEEWKDFVAQHPVTADVLIGCYKEKK